MADDTVGTAAGNKSLLCLAQAVQAEGLGDTLNDPNASYTVLAPANSAFDALPAATLDQVLADPQGQLTDILTYHVVPQRYDAQGLADAGTVTTVQGTPLTISGEPGSLVIDEQEQASVVCNAEARVPTALHVKATTRGRHLPVVKRGRCVGMLAETALIRYLPV
jgi:uncharacterized surface protein with fasciclin (FAS1) repeats